MHGASTQARAQASTTTTDPSGLTNGDILRVLERQSIGVSNLATQLGSNYGLNQPFREKFKESKHCPKFVGDIHAFDTFKIKFLSYLGERNIENVVDSSIPSTSIRDYEDKNKWLYYALYRNSSGAALTLFSRLPTDASGQVKPDGRAAWVALTRWYEGPATQRAVHQHIR